MTHRTIRFLPGMALTTLAVLATMPAGATTLDLSWNRCAPIESNFIPGSEPGAISLYASATGQVEPHMGYEVWLLLGDANDVLPDAWRFDADGCQGPNRLQIDHLPPAAAVKTCPSFQGANQSLQIKAFQFAPPALGVPTTLGNLVIANSYPDGVATPDPNLRYFLARYFFDHFESSVEGEGTPGVSCGGFERPVCFSVFAPRCNWQVANFGAVVPFEIGQGFATFRGECKSVPATNTTWGQIKGQYRR